MDTLPYNLPNSGRDTYPVNHPMELGTLEGIHGFGYPVTMHNHPFLKGSGFRRFMPQVSLK